MILQGFPGFLFYWLQIGYIRTFFRSHHLLWLRHRAERVGISNVNLSKIKNNKVTAIRFSTLAAICEVLNCDAGDILEYQKED